MAGRAEALKARGYKEGVGAVSSDVDARTGRLLCPVRNPRGRRARLSAGA